ncbi:MAG: ABC transporter ATP-binding protein [Thermoplasmatales archaeon]|nr:ABC transporter ATP-binding protein [Thermoplasmatales archaeon]
MHIKIENLDFGYEPNALVLKNINLELTGPKFVSILGPNGVGKSTLIHCINKILVPTGGRVLIDGVDVSDIHIKEIAKIIGYVPYSANDTFPLSVIDTVLMGRHPHSNWKSQDSDLKIVYKALRTLGITHLSMRPLNELSAGQHQKVMLARGLVQEPKILLLDEPTANLDIRHQISVTKMLRRLSVDREILVIMISHDINIAARYADEIIILSEGGVYTSGKPSEVITADNLKEVYGVEARVVEDNGRPYVILDDALPMDGEEQMWEGN